jgi:copper resistance protein B
MRAAAVLLIAILAPAVYAQEPQPAAAPLTDEDRQAAFPDVEGHAVHDRAVNYFVLFDQVEWQTAEAGGLNVDSTAWIGGDRSRLWLRAEGASDETRVSEAQAHVLFGRQFARWWDLVGGVRHDFRPGDAQTWAAIGVQGLAPYWFEIQATAYLGGGGRAQARIEIEYDLLLTNRLIVQPLLEVEVASASDPARGSGAGITTSDLGLRLRYEVRRELAPYVGVTWLRQHGETAALARQTGRPDGTTRFVAGLRGWF